MDLSWIKPALSSLGYRERVFSDLSHLLRTYPFFSISFDPLNGQTLARASGMVDIPNKMHIGISIWIPREFPISPPMVYIHIPANFQCLPSCSNIDQNGLYRSAALGQWAARGKVATPSEACLANLMAEVYAFLLHSFPFVPSHHQPAGMYPNSAFPMGPIQGHQHPQMNPVMSSSASGNLGAQRPFGQGNASSSYVSMGGGSGGGGEASSLIPNYNNTSFVNGSGAMGQNYNSMMMNNPTSQTSNYALQTSNYGLQASNYGLQPNNFNQSQTSNFNQPQPNNFNQPQSTSNLYNNPQSNASLYSNPQSNSSASLFSNSPQIPPFPNSSPFPSPNAQFQPSAQNAQMLSPQQLSLQQQQQNAITNQKLILKTNIKQKLTELLGERNKSLQISLDQCAKQTSEVTSTIKQLEMQKIESETILRELQNEITDSSAKLKDTNTLIASMKEQAASLKQSSINRLGNPNSPQMTQVMLIQAEYDALSDLLVALENSFESSSQQLPEYLKTVRMLAKDQFWLLMTLKQKLHYTQ